MARSSIIAIAAAVVLSGCPASPADAPFDVGLGSDVDLVSTDVESDGDVGTDLSAQPPIPVRTVDALPIEVLGPPGTAVELTVDLDPEQAEPQITLGLFNVVEEGMARLWVNGIPFELDHFVRPTGGTQNSAVNVPSGLLVHGENSFIFEYTRQVEDVTGFRVLLFVLEGVELTTDVDPGEWSGFDPSSDAVERGRSFFTGISRDGGPVCSRCHTDSGSDLEYYSFSNESIVARAKFHEFSQSEAEDIASYIRSLDTPREGRVWVPPFQPGPDNYGAAGSGLGAFIVSDDVFKTRTFPNGLVDPLAWDVASDFNTFRTETTLQLPTWFRWLPREIDDDWFDRRGGIVRTTEQALAEEPSLENAHAFMSAAVQVGKEIMIQNGDHKGRIELLRFAAVKLWDWSKRQGFDDEDHGFPNDEYGDNGFWGSPPYPYEVGFAFFEAEIAGTQDATQQAIEWWWLQIAVDPGRGRSNGNRPLNYADVLKVAEFQVGPSQLSFLHLLGSWEESRGPLADSFGEDVGPVRLLEVPMRQLAPEDRVTIMLRFLRREQVFLDGGGELRTEHLAILRDAWLGGCEDLSESQRQTVRNAAPIEVSEALNGCD